MSPVLIIGLAVGGVVALLVVGYIHNVLERNKLEQARRRSELYDRQLRMEQLSESVPAQFLTVDLKQLLHQLELHFVDELVKEVPKDAKKQARAEELRARLEQGNAYSITNATIKLHSEEQVKEVRFLLESLYAQIKRATEERLVPLDKGRAVLAFIQQQLLVLYLDYFHEMGAQQLQAGQPRQARLNFERAINLIKKQKNIDPYKEKLAIFTSLLEKTGELVLEHNKQAADQDNVLSEAVGSLPTDEEWKKKALYD